MPSPFPGMDPFLEHPVFFQDMHGAMYFCIREALQPVLPEPYFAVMDERLWVESSARAIEVLDDEYRDTFIDVRTRLRDGNERIVTTIEVLSPSNKTSGEKGRDQYLEKQREILNSDIHLVEIDLLRGGEHSMAMSLEKLHRKAGSFDYHVSVHRFNDPGRFFIYPWKLEVPLPEITIPLLPGDGEVPLDLQAVFTRCYDTGPYRRRVKYDVARLAPPLDAERTAWVKRTIDSSAKR